MQTIISLIQTKFPDLKFKAGKQFYWSPETKEIYYKKTTGQESVWSLLHETGHALLDHTSYGADFELIRLEVDAWQKARQIADDLNITIDENHIQNCLDTYRDWLYKRSICPNCSNKSLQQDDLTHYQCFNCRVVWKVTANRFCRAYRSTKNVAQPTKLVV